MKETTGQIISWDEVSRKGMIEGSDGTLYPFTEREWTEEEQPEVDGLVLVICPNGRDASQVEYRGIEHMPFLKITTHSEAGETQTMSHTRFIGGPWRMRSDALAWMEVAKGLHRQFSHIDIEDISELLRGEHLLISLRGSVIKYCYAGRITNFGNSSESCLHLYLRDSGASTRNIGIGTAQISE